MSDSIKCGNLELVMIGDSYFEEVEDLSLRVEPKGEFWIWRCLPLRSRDGDFETPEEAASDMCDYIGRLRDSLSMGHF